MSLSKKLPDFPTVPNESDDEVNCFHPPFEAAAKVALLELGLEKEITIVHHYPIGARTVDFAFELSASKKLFLLAEVKRTKASVQSTNSRLQARDYVTEAGNACVRHYYLVTNLEIIDLFKHDQQRPKVSQQLLKPSPFICSELSNKNTDEFYKLLIANLKEAIKISYDGTGEYLSGLANFQESLQSRMADSDSWHKFFMPSAFEYIRGAGKNFKNTEKVVAKWPPAETYKDSPQNFLKKAQEIDFEGIFQSPLPQDSEKDSYDGLVLGELFKSGQTRADGEDIASIVGDTLTNFGPGIVETDHELSRVLSILALSELPAGLCKNDIVCDPGSGSGRLLLSASRCFNLQNPRQIWAIEREKRFTQALYLRLGLSFAEIISPSNCPKISMADITSFKADDFKDVKVIVMNPPFISGIDSVDEKNRLARRIKEITGKNSICNVGQTGLECVYLELVNALVPAGTTICSIVPIRHLYGQGEEAINFRNFLLEDFGLKKISLYPKKGLFKDVVKQTLIISGVKGGATASVNIVNIQLPIENIDLHEFQQLLTTKSTAARGVEIIPLERKILSGSATESWANLFGIRKEARFWLNKLYQGTQALHDVANLKRGGAGNKGCSDLATIPPNSKIAGVLNDVPDQWKYAGINNADELTHIIDADNAPRTAIFAPAAAFDSSNSHYQTLLKIAQVYKTLQPAREGGAQRKAQKDEDQVVQSLKASELFDAPSILITRANRVEAQIAVATVKVVPSTNLLVASVKNPDDVFLIASFLSSCFAQLDMELLGLPQEGMRKLEKEQISNVRIPAVLNITDPMRENLVKAYLNSPYMNFNKLDTRPVDRLWADFFAGGDANLAKIILDDCMSYLSDVVAIRQA